MGGHQSKKIEKKVVIIGASFAGLTLAEKLWDKFNVILIDKNEYFEYVCTNPRALVKDSYINDLTIRYQDIIASHQNKAQFI
jgi:NADH dehydrogenase FAD-containing subunit